VIRRLLPLVLAALALSACGTDSEDPIERVPAEGGVREQVGAAQQVSPSDFPGTKGRTFDDLAAELGARDGEAALATSVFTPGKNRLAFGTISDDGRFVYGKSAVYVGDPQGKQVAGPFVAPADLLVTDPAYRSKQAASEDDPFAAIYAAHFKIAEPGSYQVLTVTKTAAGTVAGTGAIRVRTKAQDRIPDVGEPAPKVATDTLESVHGDVELLDTRQPPSDLHERSFADVVGDKPVALLFATPQLCQSRVCGPVVDVALELEQRYGDRVEFIHQEVYAANDPAKGLRTPLVRFNLETEPWLFVVGRDGKVTARLEGSFGLGAFENALETAL
jgi:hypothetical protein